MAWTMSKCKPFITAPNSYIFNPVIHGYQNTEYPDGRFVAFDFDLYQCKTVGCKCDLHDIFKFRAFSVFIPDNSHKAPTLQFYKSLELLGTEV